MSKLILTIHTILFTLFVIFSIVASVATVFYPEILPGRYLFFTALVLGALVIGSWETFGGCPFTLCENYFRERNKSGSSYSEPCIDRYAKEWFGLALPAGWSTFALTVLLILPAIVGMFNW